MCTRTPDCQGNPARSASSTSLATVPATCVQDARIGYIQDVLVFETLRIVVEPMAGFVPLVGSHHSHAHFLPHHLVPPIRPPRSTYYSGTPMASATNSRNQAYSSRHTTSKWMQFRGPNSRHNREVLTSRTTP